MKKECNHLSIGAPWALHIRWQSATDFIAGQTEQILNTIMARRISSESAKLTTKPATDRKSTRQNSSH